MTGGAGFIGSHVVDAFLGAGHTVSVVDNLATGNPAWLTGKPVRLHALDLRAARLAEVFEAERPEMVAHLAAQASVGRSVVDPAFDAGVNVLGGLNLLECCRRAGVTRVIYSSSGGAGYGDTDAIPTPESHPSLPASPYGVSKVAMEHYVAALGAIHGWSAVSLRYANVYGPRQNPAGEAGVVAIFCDRLLQGQPPVINGDGDADARLHLCRGRGGGQSRRARAAAGAGRVQYRHRRGDLGQRALRAPGAARRASTGRPTARPARPGEQRRSCLDPARAARRARLAALRLAGRGAGPNVRVLQEGGRTMIDEELRAILACPACKGDLLFEETRIICPTCRKAYPIRDGIPVMLIGEAEPWAPAK